MRTSIPATGWRWALVLLILLAGTFRPSASLPAQDQLRTQDQLRAPDQIRSQDQGPVRTGFLRKVYKDDAGEHKYAVFIPRHYQPRLHWPVIVFLHGAGERGTDGILQTTIGLGPVVKSRESNFPFIVVFPQLEDTHSRILTAWAPGTTEAQQLQQILAQVERDYSIDPDQRILAGWSMGAYGVWNAAAGNPGMFSKIVAISGGGNTQLAEKVKDIPAWIQHGSQDVIVRPEESRAMVEALKQAGGSPLYTEVPEGKHDLWKTAFDDDILLSWLWTGKVPQPGEKTIIQRPRLPTGQPVPLAAPFPELTPPVFIPALEVPRAAYIRLGNDSLATLSDSIPFITPPSALTGMLPDISDYTSAEGYSFSVYFSGLSYSGRLVKANLKAYAPDRLNVQLALSNIIINIGNTSLAGSGRSASAGPIQIGIGHQRAVWLSFDVKPVVVQRQLKLQLLGARFNIPDDNWYVTAPAGVSTRGLGMTQERVSSGLVSGLYGRKGQIEQQIVAVIPSLLTQLENKLNLGEVNQAVSAVWPLAVYQPQVLVWPQEVVTDDRGVTINFGLTAAAIDRWNPPKTPRIARPVGLPAQQIARNTSFDFGLAPDMLEPLSQMLVEADVARIHLADTPAPSLAKFIDPAVMADAIPELKRYQKEGDLELWAELIMAGPLQVADAPAVHRLPAPPRDDKEPDEKPNGQPSSPGEKSPRSKTPPGTVTNGTGTNGTGTNGTGTNGTNGRNGREVNGQGTNRQAQGRTNGNRNGTTDRALEFQLPKLRIAIAFRTDRTNPRWTPLAELDLSLRQQVQPALLTPSWTTRALALQWSGEMVVDATARFAEGYDARDKTLDADKLKNLFLAGWSEYTQQGTSAPVTLPDLDFGYTKLRAADIEWKAPLLTARFAPPGIKLRNQTDKTLVYETKGPFTGWSSPFTLKPDGEHEYDIAFPLIYRRRNEQGQYEMFTIPAGTIAEYRLPETGNGKPTLFQAED